MRAVFGLVLIVGLGLAGFAVYMVQGYFEKQEMALQRERANSAAQVPTIEVIAVNRTINYGEPLTTDDLVVVRYAEPYLPEGVYTTAEALFPLGNNVPRIVLRQMEANEPVLASKVTEPGEQASITTQLAPGMRAFTISVDVASGVSGFLRPGDRVDVYWTGAVRDGRNAGGDVTQLIETALTLVAVDQTSDTARAGTQVARTVTVQVTPQQVAILAQAQTTGKLALSLVGISDTSIAEAVEVDQRSLLGIVDEEVIAEAEVERAQVCTTRVRRGAEMVEMEIPCTN